MLSGHLCPFATLIDLEAAAEGDLAFNSEPEEGNLAWLHSLAPVGGSGQLWSHTALWWSLVSTVTGLGLKLLAQSLVGKWPRAVDSRDPLRDSPMGAPQKHFE